MEILAIVLSFAIGLTLILLLGWVFSLRTKGLIRLAFNSIAGLILILSFNLLRIVHLPLNPLNVLIVGFLGAPGVVVVGLLNLFL